MLKKALFAMLLWGVTTQGAELEIGLNMTVRGAADAQAVDVSSPRHATILVIDRSGSMRTEEATEQRELKTRWQRLQDSLAKTMIEDVPIGEVVYLIAFSAAVETIPLGTNSDELTIRDGVDRDAVLKRVAALRPDGKTVLFDALGDAYSLAKHLSDGGIAATVRVYGDGENEPPDRVGLWGKSYKPKYAGSYLELKDRFQELFAKPGFKQVAKWVSQTPPKDKDIDWKNEVFSVAVRPWTVTVQRPVLAPLALQYEFRLPEKAWTDIDGKSAELVLEVNGKTIIQKDPTVVLRKGKVSKSLTLPDDLPKDQDVRAVLKLNRLPESKAFSLSASPVEIVFAKSGSVALSSVFPAKDTVVKLNDAVSFSAKATDGADVVWRFGDRAEEKGLRFEKTFLKSGSQSFTVTATKEGLQPAVTNGAFEVVDAGVAVRPLVQPPVVGEPVTFTCEGRGPVVTYEWIVDGTVCAGETAKDCKTGMLRVPFEKSGPHAVQVRAVLRGLLPELSKPLGVSVSPAPFVAVREPEAGAVHDSDTNIILRADIEGGFTKVVWKIEGPDAKMLESPVADRGALANLRVAKGGEYKVTAIAEGVAGTKTGTPVAFSVRSEFFKIVVVEPLANQTIENGKEQRLVADVKGKGIEKVKWSAWNADTDKRFELGMALVADGKSGLFHTFPLETGDVRLEIVAEAVFAAGDPNAAIKVDADPVPVNAITIGGIEIAREEDLDGSTKAFGEELKLMCKVSGAIKPTDVEWLFIGSDGKETALTDGKGKDVFTHAYAADGREKALVDIFARGRMPDGSLKQTKKMRLILVAAERLEIVEPVNGARVLFGKNVPLKEMHVGDVRDVKWYANGAEVKEGGYCVDHAGVPETNVTVWAEGVAPGGRQIKTETRTIVAVCPLLKPKVTHTDNKGKACPAYSLDEQLTFTVEAGEVAKSFVWNFDDGTVLTNSSHVQAHAYKNYGKYTVRVQTVCAKCERHEDAFSEPVSIEEGIPGPGFALVPMKVKYGVGDIVTLKDQSVGKTDIQWWIWKTTAAFVQREKLKITQGTDGTNVWWLAESSDASDVQVKFDKLGQYCVGLEVIGKKAGKRYCADTIQVKVWRWWLPWLLGACGLLLWSVIVWLCTGNEPRNWVVKGRVGGERVDCTDDARADWRSVRLADKGKWSRIRKEAVFPLKKFVDEEDGDQWGCNDGLFKVRQNGSRHAIDLVQTSICDDDEACCQQEKHRYRHDEAKPQKYLHVWVDERPGSGMNLLTIILSFFVIAGLVGVLCARFAF